MQRLVSDKENIEEIFKIYKDSICFKLNDSDNFERFKYSIISYTLKNPKLLECTTASYVGAIMSCAMVNLVPSELNGTIYIIPYKGNAQVQLSYKGLLELAYRNKQLTDVQATCVWDGDKFEVRKGTENIIIHIPDFINIPDRIDERKKLIAVYATATINGNIRFDVMGKNEIEKFANDAMSDKFWGKWYGEMAKKTVLKRLLKTLPQDSVLSTVRAIDSVSEGGRFVTYNKETEQLEEINEIDNIKENAIGSFLEVLSKTNIEDRAERANIAKRLSKLLENGELDEQQKILILEEYNKKME